MSQEEYTPDNNDKTLHHNTPVKDLETEECLDVSSSCNDNIAQEEDKGPNQGDNACGEDDIKSQMQIEDEAEMSAIEGNRNPFEIKLRLIILK